MKPSTPARLQPHRTNWWIWTDGGHEDADEDSPPGNAALDGDGGRNLPPTNLRATASRIYKNIVASSWTAVGSPVHSLPQACSIKSRIQGTARRSRRDDSDQWHTCAFNADMQTVMTNATEV